MSSRDAEEDARSDDVVAANAHLPGEDAARRLAAECDYALLAGQRLLAGQAVAARARRPGGEAAPKLAARCDHSQLVDQRVLAGSAAAASARLPKEMRHSGLQPCLLATLNT